MENNRNGGNLIELEELIYAPLKAVSDANIKLSTNIIDFLKSTGEMSADASGKPLIHLKTIQMLYDRLRYDATDNAVKECIGLEIPLLSLLPPVNLKVKNTKISFNAEVRCINSDNGKNAIVTRVCPKREGNGAFSPNFTYEAELESIPMPEGLAGFIETLNAQSIPKKIHSAPIDKNGFKLEGVMLQEYENQRELKEKEKELKSSLEQISELFAAKNSVLKVETGMDFEEYSRSIEYSGPTEPSKTFVLMCDYNRTVASLKEKLDMVRSQIIAHSIKEDADGYAVNEAYESADDYDGYSETADFAENGGDSDSYYSESYEGEPPLGGFTEYTAEVGYGVSSVCRKHNVPEYCMDIDCKKFLKCDYAFMKIIEERKK